MGSAGTESLATGSASVFRGGVGRTLAAGWRPVRPRQVTDACDLRGTGVRGRRPTFSGYPARQWSAGQGNGSHPLGQVLSHEAKHGSVVIV